jgi:glycosyltransferase involved in cell wall biosynthesis
MSSRLKIAINCELAPGTQAGGTQSVVTGLLRALAQLEGEEEYLLLTHPDNRRWVEAVAGDSMRLVDHPQAPGISSLGRMARWLTTRWRYLAGEPRRIWPEVGRSHGFYSSLGAAVIHWPWQHFVVTNIPAIFNPHDLLHLHYPQFFQPKEIIAREALYPVACRLAQTIVVSSEWARDDFSQHYGLHPSRLQVIPWAPPTQAGEAAEAAEVRAKFNLPEQFALYPAVTWEHKNHLRLLAALAEVRDRHGVTVPLVCTGHRYERHWNKVAAEVTRLRLEKQVQFLGQISLAELRGLYRTAQFVVVPTLFEAASGPVFEAWQEDAPVACSTVTSLPQQAGDAALLFDPYDVGAIANAIHRLATETALRDVLRAAGRRRLLDFPWERTARAYRAVYRRAAHRTLSAEERDLLAWDWMKERRGNP